MVDCLVPPFLRGLISRFRGLARVRVILVELVRRIAEPHSRSSFSYLGEDMALTNLFSRRDGIYVDVGCNLPDSTSNTYALYRRGWRGICIDANEALVASHRRLRPFDQQIVAAISDVEQEADFTVFSDHKLSSIQRSFVTALARGDGRVVKVTTRTLTQVLQEANCPARFELLNIDVEGHDFQALRSLDLDRFRPQIILIELLDATGGTVHQHEVSQWLHERGYALMSFFVLTAFYIDTTSAPDGLFSVLAPYCTNQKTKH
jgi:FkbM family methyltransferase